MLIRIVKMTFKPEETSRFLDLFEQIKEKIRNVDGCEYLEGNLNPHVDDHPAPVVRDGEIHFRLD